MSLLIEILGFFKPVAKWFVEGIKYITPLLGTFTGQLLVFLTLSVAIFKGLVYLSDLALDTALSGVNDFSQDVTNFVNLPVFQSDYFHFLTYITGLDVFYHTSINLFELVFVLLALLFSMSFIVTVTFILAGFGVRAVAKVVSVFVPTTDL